MSKPKTLRNAVRYFADQQVCIDTVAALRWPHGPICQKCSHAEHYYLATQERWKCKKCSKQFSVKVGTIFEDSAIALDKWLIALWMLVNCKNGISSYEVGRALGITQKSSWFVLHRLRLALQNGSMSKMGGDRKHIEVDETFIGGPRSLYARRADKRRRRITETGTKDKIAIQGILERGGEVRAAVVGNRKKHALQTNIRAHVKGQCDLHRCAHVLSGTQARGFRAPSHRPRGKVR